jgi:hypothetical protein
MTVKNPAMLKDALHTLSAHSGANNDYCNGLTVGIVSALMAMGFTFKDAIAQVAINFPQRWDSPRYAVPEAWQTDLAAALLAAGRTL